MLCKGLCERIGVSGAISHKAADGREYSAETAMPTHSEAFEAVVFALTKSDAKVIDSFDEVSAIGHRIVQGGSIFKGSCLITPKALNDIDELGALAPLHNPAHVLAIKACLKTFGEDIPQVAVFDTSFHQTMPAKAYMFALPYKYYTDYKVRKYGAHGTSHHFVSDRVAVLEGKDKKAQAFAVGELLAKKAKSKKIEAVVFDRGGYLYTGRVASLADGAREGGLQF